MSENQDNTNPIIDILKSAPQFHVNMEKLKSVRGFKNKARYLWESYANGRSLNRDTWPAIESAISLAIKVASKASSNRNVRKYMGTIGTSLDIISLGLLFREGLVPFYTKEQTPHILQPAADKMGYKHGWELERTDEGGIGKYIEALLMLSPDVLRNNVGLTLESHSTVEGNHGDVEEFIYQINDLEKATGGRLRLEKPLKFMVRKRNRAIEGFNIESFDILNPTVMNCFAVPKGGGFVMVDGNDILQNYILPVSFFASCDFTTGYLHLNGLEVSMKPKAGLEAKYQIQNLDVKGMAQAYLRVLDSGSKRGVALIGDAGVGKTEAVKSIIKEMGDVPVVWLAPTCFNNSSTLNIVFSHIRSIPRAVIFVDDMDSHEKLVNKTDVVTTLIQCLANPVNNFILIATLNNPKSMDSTLLDRSKRFDEVRRMERPNKEEMSYLVSYYQKEFPSSLTEEELNELVVKLVNLNFTHVQVSSVFETAWVYRTGDLTTIGTEAIAKACELVSKSSENAYLTRVNGKLS